MLDSSEKAPIGDHQNKQGNNNRENKPCSVVVVTLYGAISHQVAEIRVELKNCFEIHHPQQITQE